MRDLEHRLALIREDCRKTNDEIIKLMVFLGVQNGKAFNAQPAPAALGVQQQQQQQRQGEYAEDGRDATAGARDIDHEAHMQRALEEANQRNCIDGESSGS